ncbi:MAG: alpha/beta hydrolase [Elainellaceae cyanobacterium]
MARGRIGSWGHAAAIGLAVSGAVGLGLTLPAAAAESVVLKYRAFQRSVAVEDLTLLAETGEVSSDLRPYLRLSGYPAGEMRDMLTRDVSVSPVLLSRALNNPAGDAVLDRASRAVHTRSRRGDRQALRGALVLSASDDEQITPIELIQNYPTQEMHVDIVEFQRAYRDIEELVELQQQVGDWIERIL